MVFSDTPLCSSFTPVAIHSLDALQVGSGLVSGADELVSADAFMRAGAKIFNLTILPAGRS